MAIYIAKFGIYKKSNRCVGRHLIENPGKSHLLKLADYFKIKKANEIIQQVEEVVANWKVYAKEAGVKKVTINLINKKILGNRD